MLIAVGSQWGSDHTIIESRGIILAKVTRTIKRFREGDYLAEVEVELHEHDGRSGPKLSLPDVRKLERVRKALRTGDLNAVRSEAALFRVEPDLRSDTTAA